MIKIVVDTASDLPKDLIEKYNLDYFTVCVIDEEKSEIVSDIGIKEFYDNQRNNKVYKTSQVSSIDFRNYFEEKAKNGEKVLYLAMSGGISGTFNTSLAILNEIKEKYPDCQIVTIDSKACTMANGLIALKAAKLAQTIDDMDELVGHVNNMVKAIFHIFTVGDLEYLYRGGRVSRSQKALGGVLGIRPILGVTKEKGELYPVSKVRGKKKIL